MPPTLRILLSSPNDVPDARLEAERCVESLNEDREVAARYQLKVLKWEDAPPMAGREPQEIVNYYTGRASQCDIVICIFGGRFGTEASVGGMVYPSGTYYEFLSAYKARQRNRTGKPVILLYRMLNTRPPKSPEEAEQAQKVEAFFERFHRRDYTYRGLCKEYSRVEEFGDGLVGHLKRIILEEFPRQKSKSWRQSVKGFFISEPDFAEEREKMLSKVWRMWIDEALHDMAPPIAAPIKIKIRLTSRPDSPGGAGQTPEPSVPAGDDALALFDKANHQLVIVGGPGAGKTFKMLELLDELLKRAVEHDSVPIPVVFQLSSWGESGKPMASWLIDELSTIYSVSREVARHWVDGEHLALLLDGLDEITAGGAVPGSEQEPEARSLSQYCRRRCLAELNDYIANSAVWVVLCCRAEEYAALETKLVTRRVNSTAEIVPLTDDEVQAYLQKAGSELASLRQAIAVDDTLREMAQTPFLLATMSTAYEEQPGMSAEMIIEGGRDDREARLNDMLREFLATRHKRIGALPGNAKRSCFIRAMQRAWLALLRLSRISGAKQSAAGVNLSSLPDTRYYLGVLARQMEAETKFFFVDQLQPNHDWLSAADRWKYRALTAVFLLVFMWLVAGLPTGWALGYEKAGSESDTLWSFGPHRLLSFDPWAMLAATLGCGGILALGFVFTKTWGFGVACGLAFGLSRLISLRMGHDKKGWLLETLLTILFAVPSLALMMGWRRHERDRIRPFGRQRWNARVAFFGVVAATLVGIVFGTYFGPRQGLAFGVALAIFFALTFGYQGVEVNIKAYPNQGIWQSGWNALWTFLLCALVGMLCFGASFWGTDLGVVNGILGLGAGVVSLVFGVIPLMQHLSLRLVLRRRGTTPLCLVAFLEAASALHLMRRVGGGYMFLHEYLRVYFRGLLREKARRC